MYTHICPWNERTGSGSVFMVQNTLLIITALLGLPWSLTSRKWRGFHWHDAGVVCGVNTEFGSCVHWGASPPPLAALDRCSEGSANPGLVLMLSQKQRQEICLKTAVLYYVHRLVFGLAGTMGADGWPTPVGVACVLLFFFSFSRVMTCRRVLFTAANTAYCFPS